LLREPLVEPRPEGGEARRAVRRPLGVLVLNREGRIPGEEYEGFLRHEPLDRAVLLPLREEVEQGPRVHAPPEHVLRPDGAAPLHEEDGELLPGEGEGGRAPRGARPHDDRVEPLRHGDPVARGRARIRVLAGARCGAGPRTRRSGRPWIGTGPPRRGRPPRRGASPPPRPIPPTGGTRAWRMGRMRQGTCCPRS